MGGIRKNGMTRPYAISQITTWIIWPLLVLQFLFFVSPNLPVAASIPCTLVFLAFALFSVYSSYKCTVTDPMDPMLARHLEQQSHSPMEGEESAPPSTTTVTVTATTEESKRSKFVEWLAHPAHRPPKHDHTNANDDDDDDDVDNTKHCWVCETQVPVHAMHCKYCDKCVAHFDHHCQWLNTCVGQANYAYFYMTLWNITGMLLVHLILMIAIIVDNFVSDTDKRRGDEWFQANAWVAVVTVNIVFSVLIALALSLVLQLLCFHLKLRRDGLTTYQFIIQDSKRKRETETQQGAILSRRLFAIANAKHKKKNCLAIRLVIGNKISCCDPLETIIDEANKEDNHAVVSIEEEKEEKVLEDITS